jgi:hypothetical protein
MSYFSVDVEADGPIPGDYSMISFGAVLIDPEEKLDMTFYGKLKPISEEWVPNALSVSGHSREETMEFADPKEVMTAFRAWVLNNSIGRPMFIADNNGFDWQFVNWYFIHFLGLMKNPFGFSSTNLGSFYKGIVRNTSKNFKHLRDTKHTHNPVDDAKGNAEAFLKIIKQFDIKVRL